MQKISKKSRQFGKQKWKIEANSLRSAFWKTFVISSALLYSN